MTRNHLFPILFILALLSSACQPQPIVQSAVNTPPSLTSLMLEATLHELSGNVQARQPQQSQFVQALDGMILELGGQITTKEDGRVRLDLSTGTIIRLAPSSLFTLQTNEVAPQSGLLTRLKLDAGKLWIILRGGQADVETPSGVASVRGSYLSVEVQPDGSVKATCLEGTCRFGNGSGSVELHPGQSALVTGPNTPPVVSQMTEEDFQEWLDENPEAVLVIPSVLPNSTEPPPGTEAPAIVPPATEAPLPTEPPVAPTLYVPPLMPPSENTGGGGGNKPPANTPSTFSGAYGPTGTISNCYNNFRVNVTDPEGVSAVKVKYTVLVDGGSVINEGEFEIYYNGEEYSGTFQIVTGVTNAVVEWQFAALDSAGDWTFGPSGSFTDWLGCW